MFPMGPFGRIKLQQHDAAQQMLEDLTRKGAGTVAGLARRYLTALKAVSE
jgi:hypothetical protein